MALPFFRCLCGKLHTRTALTFSTATCTCGRALNTLTGTVKEDA